jgi:hypothetical protein
VSPARNWRDGSSARFKGLPDDIPDSKTLRCGQAFGERFGFLR